MDPGQATKNGYLDFLTRIENRRSRLSTFLASDWDNIGLPLNGGPIFGTARDTNFAARVPAETIENWNQGDVEVTDAATSYLRHGDPDAGFVYLGLVDETAHLAGSATPTYSNAIATTDARIGKLLRAVRSRPTYPFESWTILVVTDHGQRPLQRALADQPLRQDQAGADLVPGRHGAGPGQERQEAARRGHPPDRAAPARAGARPAAGTSTATRSATPSRRRRPRRGCAEGGWSRS